MKSLDDWAIPIKLRCDVNPPDYMELTPFIGGCTVFICCEYNQIACIDLSLESVEVLRDKLTEMIEALNANI